MIPGNHPVVQSDGHCGKLELIPTRKRNPFPGVPQFVGKKTCGTSLKGGQSFDRFGRTLPKSFAKFDERITAELGSIQRKSLKRIGSQKRISTDMLPLQRAFEQNHTGTFGKRIQHVHRYRNKGQFLDERNSPVG